MKTIEHFGYSLINNNSYDRLKTIINKKFKHFHSLYKVLIQADDPIIFDVGGNKGQSIKKFKKIFPESQVYSFEPTPQSCQKMIENYKNDSSIKIYEKAVGAKNERKIFNVYENSGWSSFNEKEINTRHHEKNKREYIKDRNKNKLIEKQIDVETITLDSFCEQNNIYKIDLLKVDTQGHEDKVLEGAQNLLKNNKIDVIQLEMTFSKIYNMQSSFYDIEKHLHNFGYKIFATNNFGNIYQDISFSFDVIYTSKKIEDQYYKKYKM